jgi:hypothetical protein
LARRRVYIVPRILFESGSIPAMDHQNQIFMGSIGKNRSPQTKSPVEHRSNGKGKIELTWRQDAKENFHHEEHEGHEEHF